ncbi:MAG: nitroreductase family protein [Patescibacteria group bacterium]|nr:nitroreductase family protein [Patescibacteria group bacterium]
MGILDIIKKRRSIRKYLSKEIPLELILKLKEALIWAPSAGNLQSRKFYFVTNGEIRFDLAKAAFDQQFLVEAPLVVVACADLEASSVKYSGKGKELYAIVDTSLSVQNMMLVAYEAGLGTCWVGGFEEYKVKEILDLPDKLRPIALVPVGYPAEKIDPPTRVKIHDAIKDIP